jgi:hypothetical protein
MTYKPETLQFRKALGKPMPPPTEEEIARVHKSTLNHVRLFVAVSCSIRNHRAQQAPRML